MKCLVAFLFGAVIGAWSIHSGIVKIPEPKITEREKTVNKVPLNEWGRPIIREKIGD